MKYLVFDIEAVPNDEAGWKPPEDKPDAFPPPPAWKIVSIGGMLLSLDLSSYDPNKVLLFKNFGEPENEPSMLSQFIDLCSKERPVLVSYSGRRFDIPVIEQRCMRWGIQAPFLFSRGFRYRFQDDNHFDLVEQLSNYGTTWAGHLANNCAALGMPGKMDVSGDKVEELIKQGKQRDVDAYCLCDVAETAWLLVRYLHLRGDLSTTSNYNAVHAIRSACVAKDNPMLAKLVESTNIKRLSLEEQKPLLEQETKDDALRSIDEEDDPELPF